MLSKPIEIDLYPVGHLFYDFRCLNDYNICFIFRCKVWIQICALKDINKCIHKIVCYDNIDPAYYIVIPID